MLTAEQIIAAQKSQVETLFGLTQKAFEGVEKLVELNLQATKAALAESANNTQALLGVKDAQELLNLQASMMQPLAEKSVAYSRHLYDIASGTSAEFSKAAEATADNRHVGPIGARRADGQRRRTHAVGRFHAPEPSNRRATRVAAQGRPKSHTVALGHG